MAVDESAQDTKNFKKILGNKWFSPKNIKFYHQSKEHTDSSCDGYKHGCI